MRVIVLGVISIVCALAPACGGGSSTPAGPSPTTTPTTTPTITILGQNGTQAFSPNPATFGGQMVVFRNTHDVPHRVVLNDGSVDTGEIAPGATSQAVRIPASGTNYHCSLHPGMVGAVTAESGAPPPACEGPYCDPY